MNRLVAPLVKATQVFDAPLSFAAGIFSPRTRWTSPEPGLHTVVCGDEVVGHIVVVRGGYVSFDAGATPIGRYDSLHLAQRSITAARRKPRTRWV